MQPPLHGPIIALLLCHSQRFHREELRLRLTVSISFHVLLKD